MFANNIEMSFPPSEKTAGDSESVPGRKPIFVFNNSWDAYFGGNETVRSDSVVKQGRKGIA